MPGHVHMGDPGLTQNQGNSLGDRPCVRQSRICREQMGGNAMKELMGQSDLKWQVDRQEGAYHGNKVYGPGSTSVAVPGAAPGADRSGLQSGERVVRRSDRELTLPPQQQGRAPQQEPTAPLAQSRNGQRDSVGVDGMKHRPGAGQANRSTFNIFSG